MRAGRGEHMEEVGGEKAKEHLSCATNDNGIGMSIRIGTDTYFIPSDHPQLAEIKTLSEHQWFKLGDMGTTGKMKMLIGEEHLKQGKVIQQIVDFYVTKEQSLASQRIKELERQFQNDRKEWNNERNKLLEENKNLRKQLKENEGVDDPKQLPEEVAFVRTRALAYVGGGIYISVNKEPKRGENYLYDVRLMIALPNRRPFMIFLKQDELAQFLIELHKVHLSPEACKRYLLQLKK